MIEGGQTAMRLAYSAVHPDEIREGIERLAGTDQRLSDCIQ